MSLIHLAATGLHSISPLKSTRPGESHDERLARHLAWCELLHRDRLAAAAERGVPRALPQHLRLVAPPRVAPPSPSPRRALRHEPVTLR